MNYYTDALRKYAVFQGRATRMQYWMFVLFNLIVSVIVGIIAAIIHLPFLSFLYAIALLIPAFALLVRRLHDTGRSAWWLLILLVPIIGAITIVIFAVLDSQPGENQYGPNPKEMTSSTPTSTPVAPMN